MIYGTLCFAIFFSFVGTVLGGLWADNSWGRFWGWDPKENGALLIVLFNALVLHARWGGMVAGRGLALLAVGGNIVTTWSLLRRQRDGRRPPLLRLRPGRHDVAARVRRLTGGDHRHRCAAAELVAFRVGSQPPPRRTCRSNYAVRSAASTRRIASSTPHD